MKDNLLNTRKAANLLGVSISTIYRMEKQGLVKSFKTPGGQRRFSENELKEYLEKSEGIVAPQTPAFYKFQTKTSLWKEEPSAPVAVIERPTRLAPAKREEVSAPTFHKIIFGDCRNMKELKDNSVHLMVTSPPYFNAPFDYSGFFKSYDEFLSLIKDFAKETFRVLAEGRIACVNCDDMLVNGEKYPIVADVTRIFVDTGFRYRDKIIWRKPEGYIRISRRSGVILQHPYPMYFYPDNIQESILIFQKGKYKYGKSDEKSKIDVFEYQKNKWYLSVWDMTNRLPLKGQENYPAAFPDELPYRLIKLFSYVGETVLDPFLGSGTTSAVARKLRRNSIGYEIDKSLLEIIKKKIGFYQKDLFGQEDTIEFINRV